MGNRGILHDDNKQIVRTSRNTMWLSCRLEFKGRKRELMSPGTYTELFFLDEAVALAAGHQTLRRVPPYALPHIHRRCERWRRDTPRRAEGS